VPSAAASIAIIARLIGDVLWQHRM